MNSKHSPIILLVIALLVSITILPVQGRRGYVTIRVKQTYGGPVSGALVRVSQGQMVINFGFTGNGGKVQGNLRPGEFVATAYFPMGTKFGEASFTVDETGTANVRITGEIKPARRVLFDMLHVEQFRFYYGYSTLCEELKARGYTLYQFGRDQWDTGQLSYDVLENFDVLVLPNPQVVRFAFSEVQAIIDFVQNGGGLLVLGGNYPVTESQYPVKDVITYFGIEYELPITELYACVTDVKSHPVTTDVTMLYMPFVAALNITTPSQGVAFSQGKPVIGVAQYGSGRVVVIAAEHTFTNSFIKMYDNFAFALNTFGWLSELGGGPYPRELPVVQITSWNPPTDMAASIQYIINVTVQNLGKDSVTVTVTVPNDPIFNEAGWGVGELIGDSISVNIAFRTTETAGLAVNAPIQGYTYMRTYVYAPFTSSYLVLDGKYTGKIEIT